MKQKAGQHDENLRKGQLMINKGSTNASIDAQIRQQSLRRASQVSAETLLNSEVHLIHDPDTKQDESPVYEVHRRISDGTLFDALTEIPNPASGFYDVQLRNQTTRMRFWVTVNDLKRKYERVS